MLGYHLCERLLQWSSSAAFLWYPGFIGRNCQTLSDQTETSLCPQPDRSQPFATSYTNHWFLDYNCSIGIKFNTDIRRSGRDFNLKLLSVSII